LQTSFSRWNISFTFWSNRKRRCRFRWKLYINFKK
jgi:hypothetical protein